MPDGKVLKKPKVIAIEAHPDITPERIKDAVEAEMNSLENPGFCLGCGEDAMGCEPDACEYECESCGEHKVYGASELLIGMAP
jgi:hypothetical protein